MEASALPAPASLTRTRLSLGTPLLRLRSDEQLVSLFRDGNNEAFRVIHDRYRQRLFAYTRQMLPGSRQDAEDALQDVFVRAFGGLRASHRELALRAWLYRIAHNRCIDELRRPAPPLPEVLELVRPPDSDPIATAEQRESLRRLIADVRRLPDQQRSALLMRELGGMTYTEIAEAMGVSVAAVKSLLVRARVGLAQAAEARDASCAAIRDELILSHDRGVRPTGIARRHMHDCVACREFRGRLRGTSRQFAAMLPVLGPVGVVAKLLGFGGGAGGGAAAGGGAVAATGAGGTVAAGVLATGAGHVVTLLAAAAVTAGGAVEFQHTIAPAGHHAHHKAAVAVRAVAPAPAAPVYTKPGQAAKAERPSQPVAPAAPATAAQASPPPTSAHPVTHSRVTPTFTAPVTPGASVSPPASDASSTSNGATTAPPTGSGDPQAAGATTGTTSGNGTATSGSTTSPGDGSTQGTTGSSTGLTTATGSGSPTSTTVVPDGGSAVPPTTSGGSGGSPSSTTGSSGGGSTAG